jgi:hypothetical protein
MMKGEVKPSAVPIVVHEAKQTIKVPQMTSPQGGHLKEQRQEVPHMTSP